MLSMEKIRQDLQGEAAKLRLENFETIKSTNTYLMEQAEKGADEGLVVLAETQTEGRGRMFRKFYSPEGSGLYLSLLLRPKMKAEEALILTAAAAVAAAEAVEAVSGRKADIKWVNDIICDDKKVCGILAEGSFNKDGGFRHIVIGAGFNCKEPEGGFPSEIADIAGSIFPGHGFAPEDAREKMAAEFLNRFMALYEKPEDRTFVEEYKKRFYLMDKEILVTSSNGIRRGIARKLDDQCRLFVELEDGKEEWLFSGDASIRKI